MGISEYLGINLDYAVIGIIALMALVSVCMFTACSSDDDDAVAPVFPQVQKLAGEAGDELDFTFEANTNWSLASSAIWCKMEQGENTDAFVLNGQAGKQTIKVKLTDDDASKDLSVAQLVLTMGGQKAAIAEVTRSAAGYSVTVFDEEGNDITETGLVVGYNEYTKFSVQANYRFAVTNTPDWVELEGGFMVGRANENTQGGVMFKEGVKDVKYAISAEEGYSITIASEDGKAVKTIPVRFNGMPTNTMDVTYPTSSPWANWTVSLDGKTFSQTGSSSVADDAQTNTFTFSNFVPFTLKTFGDDFTLVVFQKQSWGLEPVYERFVTTTGEGGDIRIAVGATTSERECYVYALPTAEYESLGNPESMIDEEGNALAVHYHLLGRLLTENVQHEIVLPGLAEKGVLRVVFHEFGEAVPDYTLRDEGSVEKGYPVLVRVIHVVAVGIDKGIDAVGGVLNIPD